MPTATDDPLFEDDTRSERQITLRIIPAVAFTFIIYLCIGSTLAILPTYVHLHLGVSTLLAGLIVSLQSIATFISRPRAGRLADTLGPRRTTLLGLIAAAISGALLLASPLLLHFGFWLSVTSLILSRLALGIGESMIGTGATMWGIGRTGMQHTAKVISWNGVATYLALAIGAPLGAVLEPRFGLLSVGALILALCLIALLCALRMPDTHTFAGESVPMRSILLHVTPYGLALALSGMGFGVIATFITLYFAQLNWTGAALSLTIYGFSFVIIRIAFNSFITRFGGFPVTIVSCAIEVGRRRLLAGLSGPGYGSGQRLPTFRPRLSHWHLLRLRGLLVLPHRPPGRSRHPHLGLPRRLPRHRRSRHRCDRHHRLARLHRKAHSSRSLIRP